VMLIMLKPSSHPETLACDLSPRRPLYQAKLHPALRDVYHARAELASRNFGGNNYLPRGPFQPTLKRLELSGPVGCFLPPRHDV